jgi:glyceraldehyde-3-phosphate dehydrogenase (NADP+)
MSQLIDFPLLADIPEEIRSGIPLHQREYLIDGEIRQWGGPMQEVASPIFFSERDSWNNVIGSYPMMGEGEAMEALDAAVRAFDCGKGPWVRMGVEERICHMYAFVEEMKKTRSLVVNLLMWEIGNNTRDSEKEYDRTVDYIIDNIEAIKDLDRASSRFFIPRVSFPRFVAPPWRSSAWGLSTTLNETFATLIRPNHGELRDFQAPQAGRSAAPASAGGLQEVLSQRRGQHPLW